MTSTQLINNTDMMFIESIINRAIQYEQAWIDFFCGFGGVTHGLEQANSNDKIATVIACLNHDANAIGSHNLNYGNCLHIEEDIRYANIDKVCYMVSEIRKRSKGRTRICVWFSHECTHHSGAAGGSSRDADSRSLPDHLERYIQLLHPEEIWIENVKEFLSWGPLVVKTEKIGGHLTCKLKVNKKKGTVSAWWIPDKTQKGIYYDAWVKMVKSYGFDYDYRLLNCADYGCPTFRKRLFIQFQRTGTPIIWAKPTHTKKQHIPIRACLDLDNLGESIFDFKKTKKGTYRKDRKGNPVPRITSIETWKRVTKGIQKFIIPYLHHPTSTNEIVSMYYGNGYSLPTDEPSPTLTTKDRISFVKCEPLAQFIHKYYRGSSQNQSALAPAAAITTVPKLHVVTLLPAYLLSTHFNNVGHSLDEPAPVITANRKRYYLMNMQFGNIGYSVDNPSPTLLAKMEKKPNYLIATESGQLAIEIFDTDTEPVIQLKQLMAKHGIANIYMRELEISEMLRITTLPANYKMKGSKTEHKKFIGNAVPSKIVTELIRGSYYGRRLVNKKAA